MSRPFTRASHETNHTANGIKYLIYKKSKSGYYEQREKAGRLLAHRLHQRSAHQAISAVNNEQGIKLSDNGEINTCLSKFY